MTAPNRPPNSDETKAAARARARLSLLGERKAVEHGRLGGRRAGNAHQHRSKSVRCRNDRDQPDHHREAGDRIHAVDEGENQGQTGDAAEAWKHTDRETEDHAKREETHRRRRKNEREGLAKRRERNGQEVHLGPLVLDQKYGMQTLDRPGRLE